jgi:hypothetical protein
MHDLRVRVAFPCSTTKIHERLATGTQSASMGSYRILGNGDGLVSWGTVGPEDRPNLTYYHPNGHKVCDIRLHDQHHCYRAECGELPFEIVRPQITCDRQNDQLVLQAVGSYSSYLWSTGSTSPILVVPDTGFYQLYVPLGMGNVGSNVFYVSDLDAECPSTSAPEPIEGARPTQVIMTFDLLGRPVQEKQAGNIYIERYRDGRSRKIVQF